MTSKKADNSHVAAQYEKWVYPFPIMDLSTPEVRAKKDGGDFGALFYTYWPSQEKREDLDVLVAGCGSNAAARYAFNHPEARVTGIDLSSSSLAHEQYLKDKHDLKNLTLHQMRIEDVAKLKKDFDFIDTSGVLHHLPDPVKGLKALGGVLRPMGTIAVMVYGRYGRAGVYMMQELFRLLELGQSESDVALVKQTIQALAKKHVIHEYIGRTHDLKYDAGLVDTFLHQQDRSYTVQECIDFAKDAGLKFMGWWDNILYYPDGYLRPGHPYLKTVHALPEEKMWQFMELFNGTLGQHCFMVGKPKRPEASYKIDFKGSAFMNYIPVQRCKVLPPNGKLPEGHIQIQRDRWPAYTLDAAVGGIFKQIDGKKTIRECFTASGVKLTNSDDLEHTCRAVFQYLWRLSYVFLRTPKSK